MAEAPIVIRVRHFIRGNGSGTAKVASAFILIVMAKSTRVIGSMDRNMLKEPTITKIKIFILVNGSKIRKTEMEFFNMHLELFMMENGLTTNHVTKVSLSTQIKINIKVLSI